MMIKQVIPEAEAVSGIVDDYPVKPEPVQIEVTTDYIRRMIGEDLDDEHITGVLTSLTFGVKNSNGTLTVSVPHFRATKDISMKDDIVEEVGRVYGYSTIKPKPPMVPCVPPARNEHGSSSGK
jgi:phenylalanyl-tRNA synthetase beta chain